MTTPPTYIIPAQKFLQACYFCLLTIAFAPKVVHSSHLDWLPSSTIEITDTEGFIRNLTELDAI